MRFQPTEPKPPRQLQFSREKLAEAVHYVCSTVGAERLGNVKLHKILYFADMFHYLERGQPITGVEYVKQKFGPTARHLSAVLAQLKGQGKIDVQEDDYFGFRKKNYVSTKHFVQVTLSDDELKVLSKVSAEVAEMSATEVSEISHNAAWQSVPLGEAIPYSSVFRVIAPEIDEGDLSWGEETARRHAIAK